jgi:hypothetical protein
MAATARSRCRPKGRTCHLIDIENLCGGTAGVDEAAVATAVARYKRTITVADDDLVVIGSGPTLAPVAKAAWPSARLVVGRGVDGADRALLAADEPRFLADRFDRVVVGSGDHAFTELVIDLRSRGTAVCVVTRDRASGSDSLRTWAPCRPLVPEAVTPPA